MVFNKEIFIQNESNNEWIEVWIQIELYYSSLIYYVGMSMLEMIGSNYYPYLIVKAQYVCINLFSQNFLNYYKILTIPIYVWYNIKVYEGINVISVIL